MEKFIKRFLHAVVKQEKEALREFFGEDAVIRWHCSNEMFTTEEYLRANCEYPGTWNGELERLEHWGETVVAVARVWDASASFHVTSFFKIRDEKIYMLDEYWAEDGEAPKWRQEKRLGKRIK